MREEIEIVAEKADVGIREIVWVDESLPEAKEAGSVDGSPIVTGNLFLGDDDPMASNTIACNGKVSCRLNRVRPSAGVRRWPRALSSVLLPKGRCGALPVLPRTRACPSLSTVPAL